MIRKKNSFFTFCFSLMPGAGEMYLGFMKRGISIMSLFFLLLFLATWLNLDPLLFIIPIIWFYGFFDTHNLRSMPDDEFYALEDAYIDFPGLSRGKELLQPKYRTILAVALILIGISVLWNNILNVLIRMIPDVYYYNIMSIFNYIPQFIVGFAIIVLGIYLIRGKKKELNEHDEKRIDHEGGDINE